jgi:hypothetical protein
LADNLSVAISADATQLRAQLALAQADLRAYGAEVRKLATDIRQSGNAATAEQVQALEKSSAAYNAARAAVQQNSMAMVAQKTAVNATTVAVKEATTATHNHGAATEAMVLIHEAMSGRFTKMGGSLMILTQRLGGASLAMMGLAGAFAVAAMGAIHLVEWLNKVHDAKLLAEAGGIGSGISNADLDAQVAKLAKIGGTGEEAAGKVIHAFASIPGTSKPVIDELISGVRQLALRMGEDVPQAAAKIVEAWNLNERAGADLLEKTRASETAIKAFTKAAQDNDAIKARTVLLQELARSAKEVNTQTLVAQENVTRSSAGPLARERVAQAMRGGSPGAETPAAAKKLIEKSEIDDAAQSAGRLDAALGALNDKMKLPAPVAWSQQMTQDLHKVEFEAATAARKQGKDWHATHVAMAQSTVEFWQHAVTTTKEGTKQRIEADDKLIVAQEARDMLIQRLDEKGAKETLQTRLAALAGEVAANRENVALVQQLETQKLTLIRAAEGENTKLYQEELKTQTQVVRAAVAEQVREIETAARQESATAKAVAQQEIAERSGSRAAILQGLAEQERAIDDAELARLDHLIASLEKGTAAEREAMRAREKLAIDLGNKQRQEQARAADAAWQAAEAQMHAYKSAFDSIGSAGRSAFTGLINGSENWRRAEQRVAGAVVDGAVSMGTHIVAKWLATEMTKTNMSAAGDAVRAAQAKGGSGLDELVSGIVTKWFGMETAKTGATAVATGTRVGIESSAAITTKAVNAATASSDITTKAGQAAAGAYNAVVGIPIIGPILAPVAAGVAFAAVSAFMPSFAVGSWELPGDMIAQVHKGEMIIPAAQAAQVRDGGGGFPGGMASGGDVNFHVNAIDAGSVAAFFNTHGAAIARTVRNQGGNNPSLRPRN